MVLVILYTILTSSFRQHNLKTRRRRILQGSSQKAQRIHGGDEWLLLSGVREADGESTSHAGRETRSNVAARFQVVSSDRPLPTSEEMSASKQG